MEHDGARFLRAGARPDEIVRLADGTLSIQLDALAPGERFRVITGDAEVELTGGALDVTAEHDRLVAVRVMTGRVEIRAAGQVRSEDFDGRVG